MAVEFALQSPPPDARATRRKLDAYYTPALLTQALIDELGALQRVPHGVCVQPAFGRDPANLQKVRGGAMMTTELEELRQRLARAIAERDAQADLVGKLTAERDDIAADLDEARAQVWGLICAGTNIDEIRRRTFEALAQNVNSGRDLIKVMIFYQRERDEARAQLRELESTRDLLTAENARLQKERDAAVNMEADTARRSSAEIDALRPPDGSGIRPRC